MASSKKKAKRKSGSKSNWGGKRPGAGRPPNGEVAGVSHLRRAEVTSRFPVLVTVKLADDAPVACGPKTRDALRAVFEAGNERFGFRLVQYSVRAKEVLLLVEGRDRDALSKGMQGLSVRLAKALNRVWERKGKVFGDRYESRVLRTAQEVRDALELVLKNPKPHGRPKPGQPDPDSSGPWFDGWREQRGAFTKDPAPVAEARSALLREAWRKLGLLSLADG